MAGNLSGDELPLVKPLGISKQQFKLRNDNLAAELVNRRAVLALYTLHQAGDRNFFLFGEM